MRVSVSKAKVEKVVKPPHNPVLTKSTSLGDSELFFNARDATSPITKQPKRLSPKSLSEKQMVL